jgi:kumamolisin
VAVATVITISRMPDAVAGERVLGLVPDEAAVEFSLVLRARDEGALDRYLADVGGSSSSGRALPAAAFGRRFGLSDAAIGAVIQRVSAAGFDVVRTYPQRTAIRLRGTAGELDDYFGTPLVRVARPSGRVYRAPDGPVVVPDELAPYASAVAGLDTGAVPIPNALFDIPPDGLTPDQSATAYDVAPLHDAGVEGQGMTIAVYSAATFDPTDLATFDERYGISPPGVERVAVNGGTEDRTSALAGEVALDLEVIQGLAPKAQILNYEVSTNSIQSFAQSIPDVVDQVVADGRADVLSISYGITDTSDHCGESWLTPEDRLRGERSLQAAAAAGISIFVSSGDAGAYASQHFDPNCVRQSVTWPGSSAWVTSVGGTMLNVADDGSYLDEAGWEDVLWHWGSGGGNNPSDPRPAWQSAPGVQNAFSDGKRQVPDVAADADPDSGPITVFGGDLQRSGGTSAAAPFWAASTLLVNQYLEGKGVEPLGFANPTLYRLASTPQSFPPYHDVVRGGNRLRDCTPGWDYATGLGSPNVWNLARDLEATALATPG